MRPPSSQEQEINLLELVKKVWDSRKLILRMCGIGAIVGLVIGFSTPKEYTASTLIAPESRRAYPGKSALVDMEDDNLSSSITGEKMPFFRFYIRKSSIRRRFLYGFSTSRYANRKIVFRFLFRSI